MLSGVTESTLNRRHESVVQVKAAAMLGLTPRYREVIALPMHGEMSYREVAVAMDLPSKNTANALFLLGRS